MRYGLCAVFFLFLLIHKATTGENKCEIIPCPPGKGFTRMPVPDDGDLFFDMEGDPLYPNGLEYLFGIYYFKDGKYFLNTFDKFEGGIIEYLPCHDGRFQWERYIEK